MDNNNNRNDHNRSNTPYRNNAEMRRMQQSSNANYPRNNTALPNRQSVPHPPVKHRSRSQARAAMATTVVVCLVIILLLVAAIIMLARCASGEVGAGKDKDGNGDTTAALTDESGKPIAAVTDADGNIITSPTPDDEDLPYRQMDENYHEIDVPTADVTRGYQILVNYDYPFDFEKAYPIEVVLERKNRNYYGMDWNTKQETRTLDAFGELTDAFYAESGHNDVLITSAWRDLETQQSIFEKYEKDYGLEYAQNFVAVPGHSEHHSGLAMDLSIYGDGNSFSNTPEYADWFADNARKYGFILRYPEDKVEITKTGYEYWHYRFIGKPHAYYMWKNNLCLEEYIDLLKGYPYSIPLEFTDDEGTAWEIYYTPASQLENTKVTVPKDGEYELSGNNVDGFIVTVNNGKAA